MVLTLQLVVELSALDLIVLKLLLVLLHLLLLDLWREFSLLLDRRHRFEHGGVELVEGAPLRTVGTAVAHRAPIKVWLKAASSDLALFLFFLCLLVKLFEFVAFHGAVIKRLSGVCHLGAVLVVAC